MAGWVRESDEQIARRRARLWLSFRGPLLWFPVFFAAAIVRYILGSSDRDRHWPATWAELLFDSFRFAVILALGVYITQLVLRRKIDPLLSGGKVVICDRCHRITHPTFDRKCECGGDFDDFDNLDWIAD